jgi:hypothetical protein
VTSGEALGSGINGLKFSVRPTRSITRDLPEGPEGLIVPYPLGLLVHRRGIVQNASVIDPSVQYLLFRIR